jgi:hypothetical protein
MLEEVKIQIHCSIEKIPEYGIENKAGENSEIKE